VTVYRTVLAVLFGLAIPLSTALTNILAPLILILVLFEGQYQQKFKLLAHHALAVPALMLFALMLVGLLYTSAPFEDAVLMLDKYRELIYIPLLILLFQQQRTRQWGLYAFLTAMGITLVLSYLMAYGGWEVGKGDADNPFVFKNPPGNEKTAGQLIQEAGLSGKCLNGAVISEMHSNFIINRGEASALDIWNLIKEVKKDVKRSTGIELELEIVLLGDGFE